MTLIGAILKKVKSKDSMNKKYGSPPPELVDKVIVKRKRPVNKYKHIKAQVDTSAPLLDASIKPRNLRSWHNSISRTFTDNIKLLYNIRSFHFTGGKVDCHWKVQPERSKRRYESRCIKLRQIQHFNKIMYDRIINTEPKVVSTNALLRDWTRNRAMILELCEMPFILFPPVPSEIVEDAAFGPPPGVKRMRVKIKLGIKGYSALGEMTVELFTEACPLTCQLFRDLVGGDGVGYGYIGTRFFTKVPGLYWSGGDVIYNNGFGCYAQVGRTTPIGAENYHFPHSMPGLLSMKMTRDYEMCGSFNITFKPMPQFDLKNVVFGRIVRPCHTFECIRDLGSALSTHPVVEIIESRTKKHGQWVYGLPNTQLIEKMKRLKGHL